MSSQVLTRPEAPSWVTGDACDIATDPFMIPIYANPHVTIGDLAYDYLHQTQGDPAPHFSDWLGCSLPPDSASWSLDNLSPGPVSEQQATDLTVSSPSGFPSHFPLTPSPPPPQLHFPERQQPTIPPYKPSCHKASPIFNSVRKKWLCGACEKYFRGHYECNRHIQNAGKQARCLTCNKKISGREDSLRRHYSKHCKGADPGPDSGSVGFEDTFVQV